MSAELRELMLRFAGTGAARAPLYSRLSHGIAAEPAVLALLAEAPAASRIPVTLFAAIHDLLLADPAAELATWYPNLTPEPRTDDPLPALVAFCAEHRGPLLERVRDRVPQTNEIGRSALLVIGLDRVFREVGPLAHLDVGASAGLNLLTDRYAYDYAGYRLGRSAILVPCGIRGERHDERLPVEPPTIAARLGLDARPVDLHDPDQVRWLEACVWPDQRERFERLRTAIELARRADLEILTGDAVADLAPTVSRLRGGHPVVTTSWVLNYLSTDGQAAFLRELDRIGRDRDLSWVSLESPGAATALEWPADLAGVDVSVLRLVRWRSGVRSDAVLATANPHGHWLSWY